MQTFTIRDLRDRTGELVRTAEEGQLSVITKHGQPVFVAVPFDDTLLASGVGVGLAVKLYSEHIVSIGKAAKLSGMSLEKFMGYVGSLGVPVIDYDPEEEERALAEAQADE